MNWVLIVFVAGGGLGGVSAEFETRTACRDALAHVRQMFEGKAAAVYGACKPKGRRERAAPGWVVEP